MNIVLIVIDTLRYTAVSANGGDQTRTPNIDRLVADAWAFDRAFCASYPTIPHRTDLITGEYGAPFHAWQPLRHDRRALPRLLSDQGWATQLLHDTPHLVNGGHNFDYPFSGWTFLRGAEVDRPWLADRCHWPDNWGLDPMFDVLGDPEIPPRDVHTYVAANRHRQDHADWNSMRLFTTAARFLHENARRDNFFLWIDSFDPHEPWDAPPEFMRQYDSAPGYDGRIDPRSLFGRNQDALPPEARARIAHQYRAKASWMDHCLGHFVDALEETGLAGNTAVVLTADHGTNLDERGRFGKGYPVREQEGHVPLFVRVPGESGARTQVLAQPQDIFATVAALAQVQVDLAPGAADLLSLARSGSAGARRIALAANGADGWVRRHAQDERAPLFTVFDHEWVLEAGLRPEYSRLSRLGAFEYVEQDHPGVVEELHASALDEIELRGADPALTRWLRGEAARPDECRFWDGWPGPAGYTQYWNRTYRGE